MNIALVDDDAADLLRLQQLLKEYGTIHHLEMRLDCFSSGEALLENYLPYRYTIIFLDIYMDDISGIETAKDVRAVDDDTSIVFLTTSEAFRPDAFSLFATSYLIKPCVQDRLFRTLDQIGDTGQTIYMLLILTAILLLFLLMHVIFYFTVSGIIAQKKAETRSLFLETQESQFAAQQRYMKETEKARHDFRHSIRTLSELYDAGDYEAVGTYLHRFVNAMPINEVKYFCADTALNALLNYYGHLAAQEQIAFSVQVRLQETLPISDVDLCSMIGNILDNAVTACRKAEEKRIQLTVLTEDAAQLYIVAVNSFNGVVKQKDGRYLSTDRKGSGIGLSSVASTAEDYGGVARFSHKGTEFFSNVAIPLG